MSLVLHLHLPGYVNKRNYRYWAPETAQELHQRPLYRDKLTVCWGLRSASAGAFSPYVFEGNEGAAVTVTSERQVDMFRELALRRRGMDLCTVRLQQDGATAPTVRAFDCRARSDTTARHLSSR
jgi:hypothetical protein